MKFIRQELLLLGLALPLVQPADADLVHRYPFNETTGTIAEDIAGDADGTIGATVSLGQPGRLATSFALPAAANNPASRVTLPASVVPGAEFTMSAFIFMPAALPNAVQMHVISGNNGATGRWNLGINDNDTTTGVDARLFWFHNGGVGAVTFAGFNFNAHLNQWVHVGITRGADGTTRLHVNGVPQDVGTSSAALVSTPVGIGLRPNAAQFQFSGRLDDVRFYNNALTSAEMLALAAETSDTDNDGLADDWEILHFGNLNEDGDDDTDLDGFVNRIEFLARTDPDDKLAFPTGDSDEDQLDDGWEWLNFETLARDGSGDFDRDGALDIEEFVATGGLLIQRNANGSVAGTAPVTGSTNPKNANSQPDSEPDGLPDGWEFIHFSSLAPLPGGDFDGDGADNLQEFLAGSNPARKAGTPANVNDTLRVAVAHGSGIEEYAVTNGVWTSQGPIVALPGTVFAVTGHPDGYLYATTLETPRRIIRVHPATGQVTTLAVRAEAAAATAGWNLSDPQGIEVGPDGKLYFSTAFGTPAGEGVFRLNADGSGFESFIPKSGGTDPDLWDLNNARDLEWSGSALHVSARGGFNATGRPVYQFNATGAYVATVANSLIGPQGLETEEDGLLVTSSSSGATGLYRIDLDGPFPALPATLGSAGAVGGMDVIDLNGDTYLVTFNTGPGGVGQIVRRFINGTLAVVVNALPAPGNDLAIFQSSLVGDPYDVWAAGFGIDPDGPAGGAADDFEGDGTANGIEFALGLDPTDGSSRFAVATTGTAAAGLTLTWPSAPGVSFQVRGSPDLSDWSTLEAAVVGQPARSTATWTAPPAAGARRFYRVEFTP